MATAFKQVANNAQSLVATAPSPATSGTSLVVTSGDGALFPSPGNGFWATIWNATSFPDPKNDINREIVLVTAVSTDTFTITRAQQGTSARTVVVGDAIRLLWTAQNAADIATAINTLEGVTVPKVAFEAVVAASGGDYTTLSAALAGGARSIFIKKGNYTETTSLNGTWSAGRGFYIIGEDRENTVLTFATSATGYLKASLSGSYIANLTFVIPNQALGAASTGWITVSAAYNTFENVDFKGSGTLTTGAGISVTSGGHPFTMRNCRLYNGMPTSGALYLAGSGNSSDSVQIEGCTFIEPNGCYAIQWSNNTANVRVDRCSFAPATWVTACYILGDFAVFNECRVDSTGTTTSGGTTVFSVQGGTGAKFIANHILSKVGGILLGPLDSQALSNYVSLSPASADSTSNGIDANSSDVCQITGNTIIGTSNSGGHGIMMGNNGVGGYSTVTGNVVRGFSNTDSSTYWGTGIASLESATIQHFSGNIVKSCAQFYAITDTSSLVETTQELLAVAASTATTTLDMQTNSGFIITLSHSTTIAFTDEPQLSKKPNGLEYTFEILQNATGNFTVAWPGNVVWSGGTAPTITVTASKRDFIKLKYNQANQNYYGIQVIQNF